MKPVVENPSPVDNTDSSQLVHIWSACHHCGAAPILGSRYHCTTCPAGPDNDLCEVCYTKYQKGEVQHPRSDSLGATMQIENHPFEELQGNPLHLYERWLQVPKPPLSIAPFHVPDHFIVRPVFCANADASIGGYAFIVRPTPKGRPLLLTALHVMDELIKKKGINSSVNNTKYTGEELPNIITAVNIYDLFATNWMTAPLGDAGPMLVLPNARSDAKEPFSDRDIAAFWVDEQILKQYNLKPLPLASHTPEVGEPLWLPVKWAEQTKPFLVPCVIVEKTRHTLVFRFSAADAEKQKYTSGAPLLDKNGEVAGINVGGGTLGEYKLGHANHVESIHQHLVGQI